MKELKETINPNRKMLFEEMMRQYSTIQNDSGIFLSIGAVYNLMVDVYNLDRDEWIPVDKALPEIGLRVLVIDDDGDQFIDMRMGDILGHDSDEQWKVYTHWMPLPKSPTKCP